MRLQKPKTPTTYQKLTSYLLLLTVAAAAIVTMVAITPSNATTTSSIHGCQLPRLHVYSNCSFYLVNAYPLSWHERITLATLQGIINRDGPILYVSHTENDEELAVSIYVHVLGCKVKILPSNVTQLVKFFKDKVKGLIVYDPRVPGSIDVAVSYAGVLDALPVHPSLLGKLRDLGLKVVLDLRGVFHNNISAYEYLANHTSVFNMSSIIVLTPGATALIDYAVKHRHIVVRLSPLPSKPIQRLLLEKLFSKVNGTILLGFFPDGGAGEYYGVRLASKYGLNLIVSSDAPSLSFSEWYSTTIRKLIRNLACRKATINAGRTITFNPRGVYVALVMSDGDNIAYLMNSMFSNERWKSSLRGNIPIAWTMNPYTLLLAPHIPLYYYLTATSNDTLIAGVSGAGYYAPCIVPKALLGKLVHMDRLLATNLGFRYAVFITPLSCELIKKYYTHYNGIIVLSSPEAGVRGFTRCGNVTVVYAVPVKYYNYRKIIERLLDTKTRPLALVLYIDAWSFTFPRIAELVNYLKSKGVFVVTLQNLMDIIERYHKLFTLSWCCLPNATKPALSISTTKRYILVYNVYSGSLEALSRVDPAMVISKGSFLNVETEDVAITDKGGYATATIKAGPLTIRKLYRVRGCSVELTVSVRNEGGEFMDVRLLDVILDHLDTLIWPRTGYSEESPCTVGPRYYSLINSEIVEHRKLGIDPQVLCEGCSGVIVFDVSEPAGGLAVIVNASGDHVQGYKLLDGFSDGDYDRDGLGEIHTVTLSVKLIIPPGGQASYRVSIVPVGHTWLLRLPTIDPYVFANYLLKPLLRACRGEHSLLTALSTCCLRDFTAMSHPRHETSTFTTTIVRTVTKVGTETVTETVERTVLRTATVTIYKTLTVTKTLTASKSEKVSPISIDTTTSPFGAGKVAEDHALGGCGHVNHYTRVTSGSCPWGLAEAYCVLAAAAMAASALAFIALRSLSRR